VVSALFTTSDGTALNGVDYTGVTNTVSFPIGETFTNVLVPILNSGVISSNKFFNVNLSNPFAASLGYQSSAEVIITNANSAVSFSSSSYRQSENVPGGAAVIPVVRIGNPVSNLTVTVYTGTNGSAAPNVDYIPTTQVLVFGPGVSTNLFLVPLLNNTNMLSDQTVDLEMSNAIGGFLTTPSSATLTIASVYAGPGVLTFDQQRRDRQHLGPVRHQQRHRHRRPQLSAGQPGLEFFRRPDFPEREHPHHSANHRHAGYDGLAHSVQSLQYHHQRPQGRNADHCQ
jgi:hypothetical protein